MFDQLQKSISDFFTGVAMRDEGGIKMEDVGNSVLESESFRAWKELQQAHDKRVDQVNSGHVPKEKFKLIKSIIDLEKAAWGKLPVNIKIFILFFLRGTHLQFILQSMELYKLS